MDKKKAMIFAVVLAVVGVILIQLMISGEKKKYADESNLETVLLARNRIAAGTTIERSMLTEKKYLKSFLPNDAVRANDRGRIIGTAPKVDIQANQPILASYFKEGAMLGVTSRFLSSNILKGERAITVRVDSETGVAGLIRPGDYVDIIGTFDKPGPTPQRVTLTLLQAVPVLAIGSQVGTSNEAERRGVSYQTITFSVTPEEAELIEFSRRKTRLVFVLRNVEDFDTKEDIPQVDFTRIFGREGLNSIQQKRNSMNEKRRKIEVIK